jgi:hypothetical protein
MTADSQDPIRAPGRTHRFVLAVLLAGSLLPTCAVRAQETKSKAPQEAAAPAPAPAAIPASDIPSRAETVRAVLRDVAAKSTPSMQIDEIREQAETTASRIDKLLVSREMSSLSEFSPRGLYALRVQWETFKKRLVDWQQIVSSRSQALEALSSSSRSGGY